MGETMVVETNYERIFMFSDFLKKNKKTAIITFLVIFLIIWWLSSEFSSGLIFSFITIIPFLYIGYLVGGRERMLKKNPDLVEKLEKAEKRKTLDDRLGTIGLLIAGVIGIPFRESFLYPILFICGVTGVVRLIGKKRKELSDTQKIVGWVLVAMFIAGSLYFQYLHDMNQGLITYGY